MNAHEELAEHILWLRSLGMTNRMIARAARVRKDSIPLALRGDIRPWSSTAKRIFALTEEDADHWKDIE